MDPRQVGPPTTLGGSNQSLPPASPTSPTFGSGMGSMEGNSMRAALASAQAAHTPPRIDPAAVPRPTYEQPNDPLLFMTDQAHAPPSASDSYVAVDVGNCSPRFMRSTLTRVPYSQSLLESCCVPFAIEMTPLAVAGPGERPVQCVDFGPEGPPRCDQCGGYINAYARWFENGRSWRCPFCSEDNVTRPDYVCGLDQDDQRRDRLQRPELAMGSVDFSAPPSYLVRERPQEAIFAFAVDVSGPALRSGAARAAVDGVRRMIHGIAEDQPGARVGVFFFDSKLHFYNCNSALPQPWAVEVGDVDEPFCPVAIDSWLPRVFLPTADAPGAAATAAAAAGSVVSGVAGGSDVAAGQAQPAVDTPLPGAAGGFQTSPTAESGAATPQPDRSAGFRNLLAAVDHAAVRFLSPPAGQAPPVVSCFGSALTAALDGMRTVGGRLVVFQGSAPSCGVAPINPREATALYGGPGELVMYSKPEEGKANGEAAAQYEQLALDAIEAEVCVSLAVLSKDRVDLATTAVVARATGGDIARFDGFDPNYCPMDRPASDAPARAQPAYRRGGRLLRAWLARRLRRPLGWETIVKLRVSRGLTTTRVVGNVYAPNGGTGEGASEVQAAGMDADSGFAIRLEIDPSEIATDFVYVQAACLWTTPAGDRRIRVHTLALHVADDGPSTFKGADLDAVSAYVARVAAERAMQHPLAEVRELIRSTTADILHAYRSHCVGQDKPGQLVLPETLKLLPLVLSSLLKHPAMRENPTDIASLPPAQALARVAVRADERVAALHRLRGQAAERLAGEVYPRLMTFWPLQEDVGRMCGPVELRERDWEFEREAQSLGRGVGLMAGQRQVALLPAFEWASAVCLGDDRISIVDARDRILVYFGPRVADETVAAVLGEGRAPETIEDEGGRVPQFQNATSEALVAVLRELQQQRGDFAPTLVVGHRGGAGRAIAAGLLAEDRLGESPSYVDLLCEMHATVYDRVFKAPASESAAGGGGFGGY